MSWTAVMPLKAADGRKLRLADLLPASARHRLTDALLAHVAATLRACGRIDRLLVLSATRPDGWNGEHVLDEGRGLNAELMALAARLGPAPLLVIHPDLPLLASDEVAALLAAATSDAIAPDRHGTGTNALALADPVGFVFAFGAGSFARHCAERGTSPTVVRRLGLSLDIDSPDDLVLARRHGFSWP